MDIKINSIKTAGDVYEYEVTLDDHKFRVTFSENYYQKLTSGKMEPEVLAE